MKWSFDRGDVLGHFFEVIYVATGSVYGQPRVKIEHRYVRSVLLDNFFGLCT